MRWWSLKHNVFHEEQQGFRFTRRHASGWTRWPRWTKDCSKSTERCWLAAFPLWRPSHLGITSDSFISYTEAGMLLSSFYSRPCRVLNTSFLLDQVIDIQRSLCSEYIRHTPALKLWLWRLGLHITRGMIVDIDLPPVIKPISAYGMLKNENP